jgi:hypothetical protein
VVREVLRADGVPVTIYRYGWGDDVVRLSGVSGVTREQLEQPGGGTAGAWPPEFGLMEVVDADGQWVATTTAGKARAAMATMLHAPLGPRSTAPADTPAWSMGRPTAPPAPATGGSCTPAGRQMAASIGAFVGTWATQGWIPPTAGGRGRRAGTPCAPAAPQARDSNTSMRWP